MTKPVLYSFFETWQENGAFVSLFESHDPCLNALFPEGTFYDHMHDDLLGAMRESASKLDGAELEAVCAAMEKMYQYIFDEQDEVTIAALRLVDLSLPVLGVLKKPSLLAVVSIVVNKLYATQDTQGDKLKYINQLRALVFKTTFSLCYHEIEKAEASDELVKSSQYLGTILRTLHGSEYRGFFKKQYAELLFFLVTIVYSKAETEEYFLLMSLFNNIFDANDEESLGNLVDTPPWYEEQFSKYLGVENVGGIQVSRWLAACHVDLTKLAPLLSTLPTVERLAA